MEKPGINMTQTTTTFVKNTTDVLSFTPPVNIKQYFNRCNNIVLTITTALYRVLFIMSYIDIVLTIIPTLMRVI